MEVTVTSSRMKNIRTRTAGHGETVNVHEWDLQERRPELARVTVLDRRQMQA